MLVARRHSQHVNMSGWLAHQLCSPGSATRMARTPPQTGRAAGLAGWGWGSSPGWEGAAREEEGGSAVDGRENVGWAATAAPAAALPGAAVVWGLAATDVAAGTVGADAAEAATGTAVAEPRARCLQRRMRELRKLCGPQSRSLVLFMTTGCPDAALEV